MTRSESQLFFLLIVAALLFAVWKLAPLMTKLQPTQGTSGCDAALWDYVYHPQRLQIVEACKTVEGVVQKVLHEADGDLHIRLDVEDKSLLNEKNFSGQHGLLVLEPICQTTPTQRDAIGPCRGYSGPMFEVSAGMRVRVTGPYVLDSEHGWMEIHPVTSLVPIL